VLPRGNEGGDFPVNDPNPPTSPAPAAETQVAATTPELLSIDEFARIEFKVGTIHTAEAHPNADRLVVLRVDLGEGNDRQIVAGIRAAYAVEELVGRQVVVVANLKPAKLRGIESQGMLLAASDESGLALVRPERTMAPGARVK